MVGGLAAQSTRCHGNSLRGRAVVIDSSNVLVRSEEQLVAVIGLKDVVVVAIGDAVLVADRSQTDKVKKLVERLKAQGYPEATEHRRNTGPGATIRASTRARATRSNASSCARAGASRCKSTTTAPSTGWSCAAPPK